MIATNTEQSRRLMALGIKPETADMHWRYAEGGYHLHVGATDDDNAIPAWSLAALLKMMPTRKGIEIELSFGGCSFDGNYISKWFVSLRPKHYRGANI